MEQVWKLSVAGFAATAITYGPARMGFGLFLSEFRADFAFSTGTAGLISSMGFLGMLGGLVAAYAILAFWSERLFPQMPSRSFTAALIAMACGSVLGPVVAGTAAESVGTGPMFLGTALLSVTTLPVILPRLIQERPGPAW